MKKLLLVIVIFLAICGTFFVLDYSMVKKGNKPIFMINTQTYKDGGTREYAGLGYKVFEYRQVGTEEVVYQIGTLFMEYENPIKPVEKEQEEEENPIEEIDDSEYLEEQQQYIGKDLDFEKTLLQTHLYIEGMENNRKDIIRNEIELENYISEFEDESVKEKLNQYTSEYFTDKVLLIITIQESSGSITEDVQKITRKELNTVEVVMTRNVPEIGTMDMAMWHVILEVDSDAMQGVADANIVYTEGAVENKEEQL